MFDLLRKKISGFVDKLSGKKPEKEEAVPKEEILEEKEPGLTVSKEDEEVVAKPETGIFEKKGKTEERLPAEEKEGGIAEVKKPAVEIPQKKVEEKKAVSVKEKKELPPVEVKAEPKPAKKETPLKLEAAEKAVGEKKEPPLRKEMEIWKAPVGEPEIPAPKTKGEISHGEIEERERQRQKELDKKVKKGIFAAVAETITGESQIKEEEIAELLDELELGMLESDVALSVAEEIKAELGKRIVGAKVKRGQTASFVRGSLQEILLKMFSESPGFDLAERMRGMEKPVKIMVMGPNGAGKTTSIAKIAYLLQQNGFRVCIAAADTFRAAAVEQMVHHGKRLGINVVHGAYGADPASIAFDAVNHAKSHGIDVVLIDTAGRQETNLNLLNQLKKMDRVIAPQLKIYVGESIAGNAMVEQISTFHQEIKLDGVVLTKLDCDAKGGTVVSVARVTGLPILYVGTGQGYGDIERFDAEKIVGDILS